MYSKTEKNNIILKTLRPRVCEKINLNSIILIVLILLCFKYANAYEITVSREEGHFIDTIELEDYENKEYIKIDDIAKIFSMVKYWHPINQKVLLVYENYKIEMFIDNPQIIINQKFVEINAPPKIIKGSIMLPISFVCDNIAELVNRKIIWDKDKKALKIDKSNYNITCVRAQTYPGFTRVAIDVKEELKYTIEKQIAARLTVTVSKALIDVSKCKQEVTDNIIKGVTSFQNKNEALIYIDLKDKSVEYKSFLLTNPYRIVIDIKSRDNKDEASLSRKKAADDDKKRKISTIVIDPGHGGKDPGAIGPTGLKEKDVVLKISKELRDLLVKHLGLRVILTREGDYFVPLGERTRTANFNHADIFISIHTNASFRGRSDGFEVFYFAANMNLDAYALAVVMKENSVMKLEENKTSMTDIDIIVYDVLQTEYVKESSEFAIFTQQALDQKLNNKNRGTKQGPFYVLRNARMPAILIESSFITNRKDEENLRKNEYLNEIAKALYNSIIKYKKKVE